MKYYIKFFLIFFLILKFESPAFADSNVNDDRKSVSYRAKFGENLVRIKDKYLKGPDALFALQKLNPNIGLAQNLDGQVILIPRTYIDYQLSTASVSYLNCESKIFFGEAKKELNLGSLIVESDLINIPASCQIDLSFQDGSVVTLPSGGTVKVAVLRKNRLEKSPDVGLELLDGRIEVKVPKRIGDDAPFQIRTPASIAGVRGTEFRVAYDVLKHDGQVEVSNGIVGARGVEDKDEAKVSSQKGIVINASGTKGDVEDLPKPPMIISAETQQSPNWYLLSFSADVNSTSLNIRQNEYANIKNSSDFRLIDQPQILMTDLDANAIFVELFALTKSGLHGDVSKYALCRALVNDSLSKCNVNFDLSGLNVVKFQLIQLANNSLKPIYIVNVDRRVSNANKTSIKGLVPGKYHWVIEYETSNSMIASQKGDFELIAVNKLSH